MTILTKLRTGVVLRSQEARSSSLWVGVAFHSHVIWCTMWIFQAWDMCLCVFVYVDCCCFMPLMLFYVLFLIIIYWFFFWFITFIMVYHWFCGLVFGNCASTSFDAYFFFKFFLYDEWIFTTAFTKWRPQSMANFMITK